MNAHTMAASNVERKNEPHHGQSPWWFVLPTLAVAWVGMVGIGLSWMIKYEATPGEMTPPHADWPVESRISHSTNRATLVMFAHPRCPCTRASIGELALIMARCPERADVQVLFYQPLGFRGTWEKTDLWYSAEEIPGVKVAWDTDGSEAKLFCAATSGNVLLYDASGQLLFDGGITGSRGHSGDNAGRSAIECLLVNGESDQKKQAFVYGCPLRGRDEACVTRVQE